MDFRRAVPLIKKGKFKIIRCHAMNALMKIQADGTVYRCTCNLDVNRYGHGNVYETAIEKIVNSCEFIEEKANKNTVDLDRVPKTCLSCENRAYRKLSFELQNMRGRIFLKEKMEKYILSFLWHSRYFIRASGKKRPLPQAVLVIHVQTEQEDTR